VPNPTYETEDCFCPGCDDPNWEPVVRSAAQWSRIEATFRFVRCRRCGLVYLRPRVAPRNIGVFYDDAYLPHAGAAAFGRFAPLVERWQGGLDRKRARLVQRVNGLTPADSVLDAGCGRPTFLREIHRRTGARAVGFDASDAGWRDESWPGLRLHHGTIATVDPKPPFHAVTMWHALEHEPRPRAALETLRGWTRPRGTLVVEVPDFDSLGRRLQGGAWGGFHTPRHYSMFTVRTLWEVMSCSGWQVQSVKRKGTLDPFVLLWLGHREKGHVTPERRFLRFMGGRTLTWPLWGRPGARGWGVLLAIARNPG